MKSCTFKAIVLSGGLTAIYLVGVLGGTIYNDAYEKVILNEIIKHNIEIKNINRNYDKIRADRKKQVEEQIKLFKEKIITEQDFYIKRNTIDSVFNEENRKLTEKILQKEAAIDSLNNNLSTKTVNPWYSIYNLFN